MCLNTYVRNAKVDQMGQKEKPGNGQKEQTSPRKFTHFMNRDAKKRKEALDHFNDKMANLMSNRQIY